MTWATIDIIIVIIFVLQILAWGLVVAIAVRIKKGPASFISSKASSLSTAGKDLVSQIALMGTRLLQQLKTLQSSTSTIRQRFSLWSPPTGMWLHPRNVQSGLLLLSQLRLPKQALSTPKRHSKAIRLAERLGLLPPLLKRLLPFGALVQTALRSAKHLRR